MTIPRVDSATAFFEGLDRSSDSFVLTNVGCVNWPEQFPYAPRVGFAIAHTGKEICIRFFVNEKAVMAKVAEDNGRVWTDSCVEFFISFDETGYYNFEFNCIGKALLGFRKERENYVHAGSEIMDLIERGSSLGDIPFEERKGECSWELSVIIPVDAFFKHNIRSLEGLNAKGNFFKCGDDLSDPHFLSCYPITCSKPDFHREEFFGELIFE